MLPAEKEIQGDHGIEPQSACAPNLLDREFMETALNKAWVADITYIATEEGFLYFAGVMDFFNDERVG